ncbi:aquaporin [Helicoverpa armigera]|uniref:aquaporin n=1 Tax=Helicoverpa armigera TaxID=29058 RepID=UPI0030839E02
MTVPPTPSLLQRLREIHREAMCADISFWCRTHWRKILAEFISTFLLILLGCMSCVPAPGSDASIYPAFGFGSAVMFNVQIFGHISGAHMNPSVTLASVIWGSTPIYLAGAYVVAQCAGSIVGYGILVLLSPIDLLNGGVCVTRPIFGMSMFQALGIEIFITAALCFVCLSVWDPVNEKKQDSTALKLGVTILGLIFIAGPLTGASMNPARSLGPAVWSVQWVRHWVYWLGPLLGGALAAVIYKYVLLKKPLVQTPDKV